jgi:hypothetical protein
MVLGLPYERVFQAAPLAAREGLTARQLQAVAAKLGARLFLDMHADLNEATGIVGVDFGRRHAGHWVVLFRGALIDPAYSTIWEPDDYLSHYGATIDEFFVAEAIQHRSRRGRHQVR